MSYLGDQWPVSPLMSGSAPEVAELHTENGNGVVTGPADHVANVERQVDVEGNQIDTPL